jgi:hypothetical protein
MQAYSLVLVNNNFIILKYENFKTSLTLIYYYYQFTTASTAAYHPDDQACASTFSPACSEQIIQNIAEIDVIHKNWGKPCEQRLISSLNCMRTKGSGQITQ